MGKGIPWKKVLDAAMRGDTIAGLHPSSAAAERLDFPRLVTWEEGRIQARWEVREEYLNSRGELFGGYFGVLADVALAFAAMSSVEEGEVFKTSDLRLSFFKPVSRGSTIEIEGLVVNRSRSLLHVEATFRGENDILFAKAAGVFAVLPINSS